MCDQGELMDRRSWLWRRKSSDKSHGAETDSSVSGSGSISSPSERFSDEHQVCHSSHFAHIDSNLKTCVYYNDLLSLSHL